MIEEKSASPLTEEGRALLAHVDEYGVENAFGNREVLATFIEDVEREAASVTPSLDGLFRVPFDRDARLLPDEADEWDEDAIAAFYEGVAAGVEVVRRRYENPDEWRRSSVKAALLARLDEGSATPDLER